MKKEYDKKKKLVIFILAAVAVCLAGGLCFYLVRIGTPKEPEKKPVQQATEQMEVTVPEIDITKESEALEETEVSGQGTEQPESSEPETVDIHTGSEQGGDDSGKPQTREDAQPPKEKPEIKDTDATENPAQPPQYEQENMEPEQPEEPAGGTTNDAGQIYVPGFGYIDDPGAPVSESAGSDGDWNKQIGDMN